MNALLLFVKNSVEHFKSFFYIIEHRSQIIRDIMRDYHLLNSYMIRQAVHSFLATRFFIVVEWFKMHLVLAGFAILLTILLFFILILYWLKHVPLGSLPKSISWLLEFLLIGKDQQDEVKTPDGKTINFLKPEYRKLLLVAYPGLTVGIYVISYSIINVLIILPWLNKILPWLSRIHTADPSIILSILAVSQVFALFAVRSLRKEDPRSEKDYKKTFLHVVCGIIVNISLFIVSLSIQNINIPNALFNISCFLSFLFIFIMLIPFLYALYDYFDQTKIRCTIFIKNPEKIVLIIFNIGLLVITIKYIIDKISKSPANANIFLVIISIIIIAAIFIILLIHLNLLLKNSLITIFMSVFYYIIILVVSDFLISESFGACMIKFVYKNFFESFKLFNQLFVYLLFSGIVAFAVGSLNFFNPAKNRNKGGINENRDKNDINIVPIMFKSFPVLGTLYLAFILYLLPFISKVNRFIPLIQFLIADLFILFLLVFVIEVSVFVAGFIRFLYSPFYKVLDTVKDRPFNYDTLDSWRWMVNFIKNEEIESKSESYIKSMLDIFYYNFNFVKPNFRCKDTVVTLTKIYKEFNEVLRDKNKGKKFAKIAYGVLFENDNRLTKYFCGLIGSKANAGSGSGENKIVFENQPFFEWIFYPRDYKYEDFEYVYDFVCSFMEFFCIVHSEYGPDCKDCICNDLKKACNDLIKTCVSSERVENESTKNGDCKKSIVELLNKLAERCGNCLKALENFEKEYEQKFEEIKKLLGADVEKDYEEFNKEFEKLTKDCGEFRKYEGFAAKLFEQLENIENILKKNFKEKNGDIEGQLDKKIKTIEGILDSKKYKDVKGKIKNCKNFFEECREKLNSNSKKNSKNFLRVIWEKTAKTIRKITRKIAKVHLKTKPEQTD